MTLFFKKKVPETFTGRRGFSLIEVMIALGIFSIIAVSIFLSYSSIAEIINRTRISTLTTSLLNKQIELIRNVPYDNVGIIGGFPPGVIPATSTVAYEGQTFLISAFVRNIDDAFDGKTGGSPNDTAPADYKLVELQILCSSCYQAIPLIFTTWVGPQNLETSTKNGSLFINVFDANGAPVSNASVLVRNTSTTPTITINDATNNSGTLQLVDVPTSTNAYQITVSKPGYTSGRTRQQGDPVNPNPTVPHSTVASQLITAVSFAIDRISTINVATHDQYCAPVPSIDMTQTGQKLIGSGPNVYGYSQSFTTDASGFSARTNLEWDSYSFINTDSSYDLAGSNPLTPLNIDPNATLALDFLMEPKSTSGLMVTLTNASSVPIDGASVNIQKTGFNDTQITGEKVHSQTNWAGLQYAAQDGMINDITPPGQLQIVQALPGQYATGTNS